MKPTGTRNKMVLLQTLWTARWKRCHAGNEALIRDAAESKSARLVYLGALAGRPVGSAKELTAAELDAAVKALLFEARNAQPKKVVPFPNRNGATAEQVWKIRQLEAWLRWTPVPERLAGFLKAQYKGKQRPQELTHAQAWRAIEGLFRLAAKEAVWARAGRDAVIPKEMVTAEIARLKVELRQWQPPAAM